MKKIYLSLLVLTLLSNSLLANNIQLANTSLSNQNTTEHSKLVNFDVSWENSWRLGANQKNWDAAWIFVKFRKKSAQGWQHATINYTAPGDAASSGHTAASGAIIQTVSDGKGVFIYRSADGSGNVNFTGNKLRWNYGADGVLDSDSVEVNVYALEMVYVTPGAFYLGSNGSEPSHFRRGDKDSAYLVSSNSAISLGNAAGNLYWDISAYSGAPSGTIPVAFPKGFGGFYCMKYECSQQQYVDFLNSLDAAKATNRNNSTFTGSHPAYIAPFPERALANTSVADHAAYADWAGLRPMTEFEYEKACRGYNIQPVANEFAWGNTTVQYISSLTDAETESETAIGGNAHYYTNIANRPLRVGAFATSNSDRVSSGGSYYGIMEMSGNVTERVINVSTANGKAFTGIHGDGNLAADGTTDISSFTPSDMYGIKGGGFQEGATPEQLRISNRYYAAYNNGARISYMGIRCVRTAE